MIIIKVFGAGENREARVEEAIFKFLFPDQIRLERPREKKPPEPGPATAKENPPREKPELGIRNRL